MRPPPFEPHVHTCSHELARARRGPQEARTCPCHGARSAKRSENSSKIQKTERKSFGPWPTSQCPIQWLWSPQGTTRVGRLWCNRRQSLSVVVMAATHGSKPDRIWNVINGRAADAGDVLRDVRDPLSSAAQPLVWPFNGPHPSMAGLATCAAGARTAQRRISAPPETLSHSNPAQRLGQTRRAVCAMPTASDYAWFACSDVAISFLSR